LPTIENKAKERRMNIIKPKSNYNSSPLIIVSYIKVCPCGTPFLLEGVLCSKY
jgi:hypothetical protein